MKFDYKVKYKGKWYLPGEEIPEETVTEVKEEIPEETAYTKTEINRMSTADLPIKVRSSGVVPYQVFPSGPEGINVAYPSG